MKLSIRCMMGMAVVAAIMGSAIAGEPNALDRMIYAAKCAGADDPEACKAKAHADFEKYQAQKQSGQVEKRSLPQINIGVPPQQAPSTPARASGAISTDSSDSAMLMRCERYARSGETDVDISYVRAMKIYSFETVEEIRGRVGSSASGGFVDHSIKHIRTPGVRYDLVDFVSIPGYESGGRVAVHLMLNRRENGRGTDLDVEICTNARKRISNPMANDPTFWKAASTGFFRLVE